jgi:hypothetical protein
MTIDELVRIAVAGGGFTIDAHQVPVDGLVRIAVAASSKGARITIQNAQSLSTDNLVRIAVAGKGAIFFELS